MSTPKIEVREYIGMKRGNVAMIMLVHAGNEIPICGAELKPGDKLIVEMLAAAPLDVVREVLNELEREFGLQPATGGLN